MNRLLFWWRELLATFWFVPVLIILAAVGLAVGSIYLDSLLDLAAAGMGRYLLTQSPASARSILTTISGAMIGVAGTVFSITLVVLTLASSQFGPRLIRNFMYVRLNQVVLGAYIALFAYCLLVLNAIRESDQMTFVPALSILLALAGAVVNIVLLIFFIHEVAVSIQADTVVSGISDALFRNMRNLFPEELGEEKESRKEADEAAMKDEFEVDQPLRAIKNGYVQYIYTEAILRHATRHNLLVELHYRTGDYLVVGEEVGRIYGQEQVGEGDMHHLLDQFILGSQRVPQQDAEYAILQMVEIASRALSPGINDPFTAMTCIDNLTAVLTYLLRVRFPSRYRYDEEGVLRVIADVVDYPGLLDAGFNQIRQYAKGNPAVLIKLMEALQTLYRSAFLRVHRKAVQRHARMVLHLARNSFDDPNDLQDLEQRSRTILPAEDALE
jgi:uncharacterized membrane protein